MPLIRFEQAVYGSFPFWDRGYAVMAHSPGCRREWLDAMTAACQRLGQRQRGLPAGGLFALRVPAGPWMVVGVADVGADDQGRPGALAFHALFLHPRDYRRAGADPFALAGALRRVWNEPVAALPAGSCVVADPAVEPADGRAGRIAAALARGRRVALEADGPIDDLARRAWRALPIRDRLRRSVATWAFGNAGRFDLVALPRLAGVELDASYIDPATLDVPAPPSGPRRRIPLRWLAGVAAVLVLLLFGLAWGWSPGRPVEPPLSRVDRVAAVPPPADSPPPGRSPDPAAYAGRPLATEDARLVAEGLASLAARFGVEPGGEPAEVMARFAARLRYRGPRLSDAERAQLVADGGPEAARALAMDATIRHFAADRPLPDGFDRGPLRWQLDTLAWSFHAPADPDHGAAEVPYDVADALALDAPARPSPLADRFPALADYARFLARLPRR